jgi:hypothetical protein
MSREDGYGSPDIKLDAAFHTDYEGVAGNPSATKFAVAAKTITDADIRCQGKVAMRDGSHKTCNKLLAKLAGRPWSIDCPRCHVTNNSPTMDR